MKDEEIKKMFTKICAEPEKIFKIAYNYAQKQNAIKGVCIINLGDYTYRGVSLGKNEMVLISGNEKVLLTVKKNEKYNAEEVEKILQYEKEHTLHSVACL